MYGMGMYENEAMPCMANTISVVYTPVTNSNMPILDVLVISNNLFANRKVIRKIEMTANKMRCKQAITIGRNPKASLLINGTTEPSCNTNFMVSEIATSINR